MLQKVFKKTKKCLTYQKENVKVLNVLLKRSTKKVLNQWFEKSLKVLATNDFEMLCCSSSICSFKAEINRVENTIELRKKYGERTKIVLPIPEKFKTEEKVK